MAPPSCTLRRMSEPMKCPRDGGPLATSVYEADIEVDTCAKCKGVWLDSGELEAIQETLERDYSAALASPHDSLKESVDAAAQSQRSPIQCPKCAAEMTVRPYGMGSWVVIDTCPAGCGVWLDEGELQALEMFFERSQKEAEIPPHWRLWATVVGMVRGKKSK
jgi:Zn-finger nucleic acid-binding protein